MSRLSGVAGLLLILTMSAEVAAAQPADTTSREGLAPREAERTETVVVAGLVGELSPPQELEMELRGGREADPQQWPATFWKRFSPTEACTGSIVGPQVVLLAAHCIADKGLLTFKAGGTPYEADCFRHPQYQAVPRNKSADYALCKVRTVVTGVPFERLNTDPGRLAIGAMLLLTGFGCTTDSGTGGQDDIYRIGDAQIRSLPGGPSDNYLTTKGTVALCFGDSGGPAFLVASNGTRLQVSVNSRVGQDAMGRLTDTSFLSSVSSPQARDFIATWPGKGSKICGVHDDATGCRP